jgi:hypothetical protein
VPEHHLERSKVKTHIFSTAVLELMNLLLDGFPPSVPSLHASALIALEIPEGPDGRPIAVGDIWIRLSSLCAMTTCTHAGPSLAPLLLGVGTPWGASAWTARPGLLPGASSLAEIEVNLCLEGTTVNSHLEICAGVQCSPCVQVEFVFDDASGV